MREELEGKYLDELVAMAMSKNLDAYTYQDKDALIEALERVLS